METGIKRLEARGIHGRLDLDLNFYDDINVLYGRNGTGKTTALHIIANILNGSITRFAFLTFDRIHLETLSNKHIIITRRSGSTPSDATLTLSLDSRELHRFRANEVFERSMRTSDAYAHEEQDLVKRIRAELQLAPCAYFPAFRTMIEAWSSVDADDYARRVARPTTARDRLEYERLMRYQRPRTNLTEFARRPFGNFVPPLNYPSPRDIEMELSSQVQAAAFTVANETQRILSESFIDAFAALSKERVEVSQTPDEILEEIRQLLPALDDLGPILDVGGKESDVYARLRDVLPSMSGSVVSETAAQVLEVYRRSLVERIEIQRNTFAPIERYISAVNEFLEGKQLVASRGRTRTPVPWIRIKFAAGGETSLRALSSGERQIVSMLYASTQLSDPISVVLIDEPEISLHIDWQRLLLRKMAQQLGARQIIVCTHSPEIGADYEERLQEVAPKLARGVFEESDTPDLDSDDLQTPF